MFIILAHQIILNRQFTQAQDVVRCSHLNALYTDVEA